MKKVALLPISLIGLLSCSTNQYQQPQGGDLAKLAFKQHSVEAPTLSLVSQCQRYTLEPSNAKQAVVVKEMNVDAEHILGIGISYSWHGKKMMPPGPAPDLFASSTQRVNTLKEIEHCDAEFYFTPQTDKNYTVLYAVLGNSCIIKVMHVVREPGALKEKLYKVEPEIPPQCHSFKLKGTSNN